MKVSEALFPTYQKYPISLVKGEGSFLWDESGKKYLDFTSGLGVTNIGHCPSGVKQKLMEQLGQLWHVSNLFPIREQAALAEKLVQHCSLDRVFFCNSGAEANEAAIKLARRYMQRVRQENKFEVITFTQSFHGRTLATLTATGQDKVKEGFSPLPEGFKYAPYNDPQALEKLISEQTCAIMLEMVQGEGGVVPASQEMVDEVVRLCQKYDLLLIVDEVQTGMGRTGKLFAYEHYGIEPDVVTIAKGLGSGFPIGAMLAKERFKDAFPAGSHGTTFGGNPLASTAGLATLDTILEQDLCRQAAERGELLLSLLQERLHGHPWLVEIRGKGLMLGIVCRQEVAPVIKELQQHGLLTVPAGPKVLRLLPHLTVSEADLRYGVELIAKVFNEMKKETVS